MNQNLKVLVSIDSDLASARISVHGTVTPRNLGTLYLIIRRTNNLAPGMDITLDLTAAATSATVLEDLRATVREQRLPPAVDPLDSPCRLELLTSGVRLPQPAP